MSTNINQHNEEIQENLKTWNKKPALREIYLDFYRLIARQLAERIRGRIVEIGSGLGNIREVIPDCLRTDLFANPWIDQVENIYRLSFSDSSVSNIILFDVFHHLRYPGTALKEIRRILAPSGRALIFEPYFSLLGWLVFGLFHHESLGRKNDIEWYAPEGWENNSIDYFASIVNAYHIFCGSQYRDRLTDWRLIKTEKISGISYVARGGYSKPQLYPDAFLPVMKILDKICGCFPSIFATRLLVVLEKK